MRGAGYTYRGAAQRERFPTGAEGAPLGAVVRRSRRPRPLPAGAEKRVASSDLALGPTNLEGSRSHALPRTAGLTTLSAQYVALTPVTPIWPAASRR